MLKIMTALWILWLSLWSDPCPGWPQAVEVERFPPLPVCQAHCEFNDSFRNGLKQRRPYMDWWERRWLFDATEQANGAAYAWMRLMSAHIEESERARRSHLNDLRWFLGDEDFYNGVMPDPVPLWWFRSSD